MRDRLLAISPSTSSTPRPMRIKREDCDVPLLSLDDFELSNSNEEGNEDGDDMKMRKAAEDCVQKAMLCWCTSDLLLSHPALSHHHPTFYSSAPYTSTSTTSMPMLENSSSHHHYHIAPSSTSESVHEELSPATPQEMDGGRKVVYGREAEELGARYGVDGEYDDYMEYLKPVGQMRGKGKDVDVGRDLVVDRSSWAFQLDCENDRVVQV
jgi:hypothetical protein